MLTALLFECVKSHVWKRCAIQSQPGAIKCSEKGNASTTFELSSQSINKNANLESRIYQSTIENVIVLF